MAINYLNKQYINPFHSLKYSNSIETEAGFHQMQQKKPLYNSVITHNLTIFLKLHDDLVLRVLLLAVNTVSVTQCKTSLAVKP